MSRLRVWIVTAAAALGLAAIVVLLTPRIGLSAEEALHARLSAAAAGLRAQLELVDARLAPRGIAHSAELAEALQQTPGAALAQAPAQGAPTPSAGPRPDERALRAAAAMALPEPDLIAVGNAAGAVVSRRGRPAQQLEEAAAPPQLKPLLDGTAPAQGFVVLDKELYRVAWARVPGGQGAVVTGTLIDDRFAAGLRGALGADVSFFAAGSLSASSLPGRARDDVLKWNRGQGPGYGRLDLDLGLPAALSARLGELLPFGLARAAVRGERIALESGVDAAVTVSAVPAFAWIARTQALGIALVLAILLVGFVWGLLAGGGERPRSVPAKAAPRAGAPHPAKNAEERLKELVDQDEPEVGPIQVHPRHSEAPPPESFGEAAPLEAEEGRHAEEGQHAEEAQHAEEEREAEHAEAAQHAPESLDPEMPAAEASPAARHELDEEPPPGRAPAVPEDPAWGSDLLHGGAARAAARGGFEPPAEPHPGSAADEGWEMPPPVPKPPRGAAFVEDSGEAPTLVQPVSRDLLDRTRGEPQEDRRAPAPPPPPPAEGGEEAHFHDTFEKFVALRQQTGEGAINVTYEKFAARLRKNRDDLLAKHGAREVRFMVYLKDGKAAIKASAIR